MNVKDNVRFDAKTYKKFNSDLAEMGFSDQQLLEHFLQKGCDEKRLFAPTASTAEYLSMRWLRGEGIEIGAGISPTPLFGTTSVVYADINGGEQIFGTTVVSIQYSVDEDVLEHLKGRFDFGILSHVLEHSDGLIESVRHLLECLKPGGIAYIVVPDKCHLIDKEWMHEFPIEHHIDELSSPGIYDAEHDRSALSALINHPELSNPSGDHQVFDNPCDVDTIKRLTNPDFRKLLAGNSKENPYRFAIHKHTYSAQGWNRLFADLQTFMHKDFDIVETRYGVERSDCHFVLQKRQGKATEKLSMDGDRLTLGISYYKNSHLVDKIEKILPDLIKSEQISSIILINDSPNDVRLGERLLKLQSMPKVHLVFNPENFGYTKSINYAYRSAKEQGTHLVCINSDVDFTMEVIEEIVEVSKLDNQIGFVFPRADSDPLFGLTGMVATRSDIRRKMLPRFQFTPTAVGYFLFINRAVLDRFDGFDELFSPGYEEENDFVLRAGAVGFRPALANHALVCHQTSSSFSDAASALKDKHHKILLERHPYFSRLVHEYEKSSEQALYDLANKIKHNNDLLVDCFDYPPVLNGTVIYARDLICALDACNRDDGRVITVLIREDVYELMKLRSLMNLRFWHDPSTLKPHFYLLRVAQPFDSEILRRSLEKSLCSVNIFFDTIAQDIPSLRSARTEAIWYDLTEVYRNVVFISDATRRTFLARYPARGARLSVIHPSLDIADYGPDVQYMPPAEDARVLVVGNQFPHKDIAYTIDFITGKDSGNSLNFDVLTDSPIKQSARVAIYKSGGLAQREITNLYCSCKFVIYPSYYEGFGLPLMESLHFGRLVIARYAPLYEEIKALIGPLAENIHLYNTGEELTALLRNPPQWIDAAPTSELNWKAVAQRLLSVIDDAVEGFDFEQRCEARTRVFERNYPAVPLPSQRPSDLLSPLASPAPAEILFMRLDRLRQRFPFTFRTVRFFYRKFLK